MTERKAYGADILAARDRLMGALIGLARSTENNTHLIRPSTTQTVLEGLAAVGENGDAAYMERLLERVIEEKRAMVPNCFHCASPCGRTADYDMALLGSGEEDVKELKLALLRGLPDLAEHALHAAALDRHDREVDFFIYKALYVIGAQGWGEEQIRSVLREMKEMEEKCVALLDGAAPE